MGRAFRSAPFRFFGVTWMTDEPTPSLDPETQPKQDSTTIFRMFLGALLVLNLGIFIWSQSTSGILDRTGKIRGRDFLQFYIAGKFIVREEQSRLYEQERFFAMQVAHSVVNEKNPRYYSLYPPTVALLFFPFAGEDYSNAIVAWWILQAILFATSIALLLNGTTLACSEKSTAWLVAATYYPLGLAILNGQLTPFLLLAIVLGFSLLSNSMGKGAGVAFSILLIKPQFAAGLVIWLLLRREWKTLFGMAIGGLLQIAIVYAALGAWPIHAYASNLKMYAELSSLYRFSPDYEHSLSGILTNLFGHDSRDWMKIPHFAIVLVAAVAVWRMSTERRAKPQAADNPLINTPQVAGTTWINAPQAATAVIFMLLFTPHLLVYDLTLLLAPMAWLWSADDDQNAKTMRKCALGLYAAGMLPPLYLAIRFSLTPLILLWTLWKLTSLRGNPEEK